MIASHRTVTIHAKQNESVSHLFHRVLSARAKEIVVAMGDNTDIRRDASLRRAIAAAAHRRGKHVSFTSHVTPEQPNKEKRDRKVAIAVQSARRDISKGKPVDAVSGVKLAASSRTAAVVFLVGAMGLTAVAAAVFAPRASVRIVPVVQPIGMSVELSARTDAADRHGNVVPAVMLVESQEVSGSFAVESREQRGEKASGSVRIVNRTAGEQQIKSGSRLADEHGTVVIMQQPAFVPPQEAVTVPVIAEEGGEAGNMESGRLDFVALDDSARSVLYAETTAPLTGGTDEYVFVLSEEDIDRAADELLERYQPNVQTALEARIPAGSLWREEVLDADLDSLKTDFSVGAETETFHLSATLRVRFLAVMEDQVRDAILAAIHETTGEDADLVRPVDAADWSVDTVDWRRETVDIHIRVDNTAYPHMDADEIATQVAERTADGAETFLIGLPGISEAEVNLSPFWVNRIPRLRRNIHISIDIP